MAGPTQVGGMGALPMTSYVPVDCAVTCSAMPSCNSFNFYVMRAPSQRPNKDQCPNPRGNSYYVCTLWGEVVDEEITTTVVRWADFQVVAAGSNGLFPQYSASAHLSLKLTNRTSVQQKTRSKERGLRGYEEL